MKVFVVGGAVRDELLGLPVADYDYVVVGATPEQLIAEGYTAVGNDFPVFLHPHTHAEYALARTERKSGPGYTGFTCYAAPDVTLEEDLLRRDLTINAIAKDEHGNFYDPYNGVADIKARKLRHVSDAFHEDPLRVLRVARFLARFHEMGFNIAEETMALMQKMVASGELQALTAERVWQETYKALLTANPEVYLQTLHKVGALSVLLSKDADADSKQNANNPSSMNLTATSLLLAQLQKLSGKSLQDLPAEAREEKVLQRYVMLCIDLHTELSENIDIASAFKVPQRFQRTAKETELLVSQLQGTELQGTELQGTEPEKPALNAKQLLTIFQRNDSWRRPEQFNSVLQCLQIIFGGSDIRQRPDFRALENGLAAMANIDVQKIMAAGFQNQEISQQLNLQREQVLEQLLTSFTSETKQP
ncbi:tRNA nucleotidyltransferase/poly(A) polymerase [Idiomarina sp. A28L]|uniref:tRNA nucleotidyltransferase/poly(A) polymerase n=1 Tax=Idiomarina sp. A28L TaxID=1036674 RepID=UPI000213896B|nr:tRNA nucleotidyltransferase/poly(A) polymerase [Idiomarina sp. A28L]EGN76214.1 tRNA nucleotidyltransferase/poly(A) polymerase [Idiomarina sp. A28L]